MAQKLRDEMFKNIWITNKKNLSGGAIVGQLSFLCDYGNLNI